MAPKLSKKMNEWLGQLGEELRETKRKLESARYAVKELKEKKSVILRKINFIHFRSHAVPTANGSGCIVDFDAYSYLPKGKTASDTLSKNYE